MFGAFHPDYVIPAVRIARIRRGKYVRIPAEWRGRFPVDAQISQRQSKHPRKHRRGDQRRRSGGKRLPVKGDLRLARDERRAPDAAEWD